MFWKALETKQRNLLSTHVMQYHFSRLQFHAKYPRFVSQSECEFSFTYAILFEIFPFNSLLQVIPPLNSQAFRRKSMSNLVENAKNGPHFVLNWHEASS